MTWILVDSLAVNAATGTTVEVRRVEGSQYAVRVGLENVYLGTQEECGSLFAKMINAIQSEESVFRVHSSGEDKPKDKLKDKPKDRKP